jgi:hypothetical protein
MNIKHVLTALAGAASLAAALPAAAEEHGRGYDHRGRGEITVRTERGQFSVDRGDRLYYRLADRPYGFRPGRTYVYTDRCNRSGCLVLEFAGDRNARPGNRFFAPYLPDGRRAWRGDDDWRRDNRAYRGSDQDWRGDAGDRGRDDQLEGGPNDRGGRDDGNGGNDRRDDGNRARGSH